MSDLLVIDSITEATQLYLGCSPDHPLLQVVDLSKVNLCLELMHTRICSNFYTVAFKQNAGAQVRYGRNHYDFSSGVITAYAPGQIIEMEQRYQPGDLNGWMLMFHSDLLLQHPLKEAIKRYGYFSYDVYEALHLSDKEQQMLCRLVSDIDHEAKQNLDEFSLDILVACVDLLLKYIDRYFNRQFLTRRPFYQDSVERFCRLVDQHLLQAKDSDVGLPTVNQLADEMHMSANYMSDLLRKQTGKSAQELIHQQLIEKAKYLLLNSNDSVSTIAYQLGFDYPQYFSRIFKKKTSMTPQAFRKLH